MKSTVLDKFSDPTLTILVILVVLALTGGWKYAGSMPGIDFYTAWSVADAVRNDTEHNIYTREGHYRLGREYRQRALSENPGSRQAVAAEATSVLQITGSPFLYWVISLISSGDYERDLTRWHALMLLSFSCAILVFCRELGFSRIATLVFLLPCLVWMEPLHSDLRVANVNSVQLGVLALSLWMMCKDMRTRFLFFSGFLLALLVMFKPNLAPVAFLLLGGWLIRGRYARLLAGISGMAAGSLLAFVLSSQFFGNAGVWLDWLRLLSKVTTSEVGVEEGNLTNIRYLGFGFDTTEQAMLALVFSLIVLGFLWWGRRRVSVDRTEPGGVHCRRERLETILLLSMGCLVHMLISSLVWPHYYVLAIPMLVTAFRPWSSAIGRGLGTIVVQRALPAVALICMMATPIRGFFAVGDLDFYTVVYFVAVSILFILGLWQLRFLDAD